MIRVPTHRAPTHPGEMLLEDFLKPMGLTQRDLANSINVPYQRVNEIINGKRGITPSTALKLIMPIRFYELETATVVQAEMQAIIAACCASTID